MKGGERGKRGREKGREREKGRRGKEERKGEEGIPDFIDLGSNFSKLTTTTGSLAKLLLICSISW